MARCIENAGMRDCELIDEDSLEKYERRFQGTLEQKLKSIGNIMKSLKYLKND